MLRSLLPGILPAAQILVSALIVTVVLLQPSTAGVGGSFGGADTQGFRTKRGFEKFLFIATIVLGVLFVGLCVLAVVVI